MDTYKIHLKEILDTDLTDQHWVNGSFITSKKYPNDIDLFTTFNGEKIDELSMKKKVDDIICNAQKRFNNLCDSHRVYKYLKHMKKEYKIYELAKTKFLGLLLNSDREHNLKGVINIEIDKIKGDL